MVFLPFFLFSCKGEQAEEVKEVEEEKKPEPVSAPVPEKALPQPLPVTPVTEARRNPFVSYLALGGKREERPKTPLECCDVNMFRVMAVLSAADTPMALIQAPDGKNYTAKKGDRIGLKDGKIVTIEGRGIIVEEVETDEEGRVIARPRVELTLPAEKETTAR